MGKIINLFTGKPLDVAQDKEHNDEVTSEHGKFVGSLDEKAADIVLSHQALTESLGNRIDELMGEYLYMLDQHHSNIKSVLEILGVKKFDPEREMVMVSEEGKVWIVEREDVE